MNMRSVFLAALVAAIPATSLAQDAMHTGPADEDFMKAMKAMQEDMQATKPTGDADKDFVMMMMPHHQGAIDMAKVELKYGKDKTLRKMAEDIVKAQEKEIAEMKAWQAKHAQ